MYPIHQLVLLLAHLCCSTAGYLYSGHDFNLLPDLYSPDNGAQRSPSNFGHSNAPSAPQFLVQPPSQVTFLNETGLVLPCSVYAQPKATIKWLQPNAFDVNSYLYNGEWPSCLHFKVSLVLQKRVPSKRGFLSEQIVQARSEH